MRTILRQSELVTDAYAAVTNPLSYNEVSFFFFEINELLHYFIYM